MNHDHHPQVAQQTGDHLSLMERLQDTFSQYGFMPHGHCYLWKPLLVWMHVISDALIGLAYLGISITLYVLVKRINIGFNKVVLAFGVFIAACGLTHLMEIWNLWNADYWWAAWVKVITAIASVATGIYLFRLRHAIVQVAEAAKLAEERRLDLEVLTEKLEQRVKERTEELAQAVVVRDQFLSIASHELKTPLTTLKLQAQLQGKKLNKPESDFSLPDAKNFVDTVTRQSDRLSRLVEDMLDVSRIQAGKLQMNFEPTEVCNLVKETLERFLAQFEKSGNSVEFKPCPTPINLNLDPFRIEQVINNIFTNIVKYAPGTPISIKIVKSESDVQISVQDQGPGIAEESLDKIFLRFERAISAKHISGLGLGLFISRQITLAHGGKIWAESKLGEGATFIVSLPLPN